jgi:peroxiredoxin
MKTAFRSQAILLGEGVDVGYSVEKISMRFADGKEFVTPVRGVTTLLVCAPFLGGATLAQLKELDKEFSDKSVEGFEAVFVLSDAQKELDGFEFFKFVVDDGDDFADEFGVKICSGELKNSFAKALFVISRDHVLFYHEICEDVEGDFNLEKLYFYLGKALNVYTGSGCH